MDQRQSGSVSQPLNASEQRVVPGDTSPECHGQPLSDPHQRKILSDPRPARAKDHCAASAD